MAQRHRSPNEALMEAVEKPSVEDLREALEAGANPRHEWAHGYFRWTPAERLASHWFNDMHVTNGTLEGRSLACLRLLHERGGFSAAEASGMLVTAARQKVAARRWRSSSWMWGPT